MESFEYICGAPNKRGGICQRIGKSFIFSLSKTIQNFIFFYIKFIYKKGNCPYHENSEKVKIQAKEKKRRWTETEHRNFLHYLKKYGKGNWKKISEKIDKTALQIESHATKYFNRCKNANKLKRSVNDITRSKKIKKHKMAKDDGEEKGQIHLKSFHFIPFHN